MLRTQIYRFLHDVLKDEEKEKSFYIEDLEANDRALFTEVTQGTLRNWFFLQSVLSNLYAKKPSLALSILLTQFAYERVFLDQIPDYASFSELQKLAAKLKVSEKETAFIHAILKKLDKEKITTLFNDYMQAAQDGSWRKQVSNSQFWATLNVPTDFLDVVYPQASADLKNQIVLALAAMKQKMPLLGYFLTKNSPAEKHAIEYESAISKRVWQWNASLSLLTESMGVFQVQGESSIHACDEFAKIIQTRVNKLQSSDEKISVLEIACGKGGKLLSTLSALKELDVDLSKIAWTSVDVSEKQLEFLKKDKLPLIKKYFPEVDLNIICEDFSTPAHNGKKYDLIWLDAPCSGLGTLAKLPQIALTRVQNLRQHLNEIQMIQQKLGEVAMQKLLPNGLFFYTVCTFTKSETVGFLEAFKNHFEKNETNLLFPSNAAQLEGFFLAKFINLLAS